MLPVPEDAAMYVQTRNVNENEGARRTPHAPNERFGGYLLLMQISGDRSLNFDITPLLGFAAPHFLVSGEPF